jgi:hypothetical protein
MLEVRLKGSSCQASLGKKAYETPSQQQKTGHDGTHILVMARSVKQEESGPG